MTQKTVFISYSHKDEAWKDKLLPQLQTLATAGINMVVWQDRKIDGGDQWYPEIQAAMGQSAAAVLLITPDFLASDFCVKEEVPALLKRQEEQDMLLIPVLVRACVWKAHRWLSARQMIPRDGQCVAVNFTGDLADTVFADVANQVWEHFAALEASAAPIPAALVAGACFSIQGGVVGSIDMLTSPGQAAALPVAPSPKVDLTHLPATGSALFGRDAELAQMDAAWTAPESAAAPPVRVLAFIAHGGVGKSTLVNHWLAELARENYPGASAVFGWSFYSQGVREQTAASSDMFIDAALRFFGDADPSAGSPWDKGSRLAHLVGSQRALLVLDGLEPLQSPHTFDRGTLRDPAMSTLLRTLARQSLGLRLVTTREPLTDLAGKPGVYLQDLEQISAQAGRALLRTAGVVGTDAELLDLAQRFGPHALAASLLGVYLYAQPGHGVAAAKAVEDLPGAAPIYRVLAAFECWLGDAPALETLRLLGLFDRPADAACLAALRQAPLIPGLNEHLLALDAAAWRGVLARLEKLRLVHVQDDGAGQATVDAHPLVREHFAAQLQGGEAWRAGHQRLFEHLCASTKEGDSPTLQDLQPLYQAVAHGCLAGLQQRVRDEVYYDRICRQDEAYSTFKLGAIGSDLGAVACFFEEPWYRVSPRLHEGTQAWLINDAAFSLRALGRLGEALEPMRTALQMQVKQEKWEEAAIVASNLSELALTLGDIHGGGPDSALHAAEQAVDYADRSDDVFMQLSNRTTHADALHQSGQHAEALRLFREAEAMQAKNEPTYPLLYSMAAFRYADLLLAPAERAAWRVCLQCPSDPPPRHSEALEVVEQRATKILRWAMENNMSLLDVALDHLTLGCTTLYSAVLQSIALGSDAPACVASGRIAVGINEAVDGLRRAGVQHHIPRALLTRAWLRQLQGHAIGPNSAQTDLDDAWEIAERGPMPLFQADIYLHRARLFLREATYPWHNADGSPRRPQDDLAAARHLIEKHGYGRRLEELQDAEAAASTPRQTASAHASDTTHTT